MIITAWSPHRPYWVYREYFVNVLAKLNSMLKWWCKHRIRKYFPSKYLTFLKVTHCVAVQGEYTESSVHIIPTTGSLPTHQTANKKGGGMCNKYAKGIQMQLLFTEDVKDMTKTRVETTSSLRKICWHFTIVLCQTALYEESVVLIYHCRITGDYKDGGVTCSPLDHYQQPTSLHCITSQNTVTE